MSWEAFVLPEARREGSPDHGGNDRVETTWWWLPRGWRGRDADLGLGPWVGA